MFRTIYVPTDFSSAARDAYGPAAGLARKFGSRLCLAHLLESPQIFTPWQVPPSGSAAVLLDREAQVRLDREATQAPELAGLKVETRLIKEGGVERLCELAEEDSADLIVLATHGRSGIRHFLLGSFASKLLQLASGPVLVVRSSREREGQIPPLFHPARILVPHDFSKPAREALRTARSWARSFDAAVRLLFVVQEQVDPGGSTSPSVAEHYERRGQEALERLGALARAELDGLPVETAVRIGHPGLEIAREAAACRAGLVVMASRGLTVIDRLPLGSIAERTIHEAPCPVLVTRG